MTTTGAKSAIGAAAVALGTLVILAFAGTAFAAPVPRPRPDLTAGPSQDTPPPVTGPDMKKAVPVDALSKLPSTTEQFRSLRSEIARQQPAVASARQESTALAAEARTLQQKLIATAARIESLEREKVRLDADIARLAAEDARLSASFARDRISVARLLAILERLQHDMPSAMALRPDDALAAARGAMLVGASLPHVYGEAAALARRIETLQKTRAALVARRIEGVRNAAKLTQARIELNQLLAMKRLEADAAATRYGDLKQHLDAVALQAASLQELLARVAALRSEPASRSVVLVTAQDLAAAGGPRLLRPVVGRTVRGGIDGVGGASAPGLTYDTLPGAQVIAPGDGRVLFAGPYHKSGQVLILEMTHGYDAVLAGLDRLEVRPDDQVLAGEPVGAMSKNSPHPRLYFELRQNGHGISPAPYIAGTTRKAKKS